MMTHFQVANRNDLLSQKMRIFITIFLWLFWVVAAYGENNQTNEWNKELQESGKTLSGNVVDERAEGLPGVSVIVKGTATGTTTDFDGNFTLPNLKEGDVVVFSFIGMETQEVRFTGQSQVSITLTDQSIGLEEVVAIGYGVQKKANLTGSVASVDAEQINMRATQSISSALSGTMAGVAVTQTSGAPGSQTGDIAIRGKNSINGGSPLIIVDGVPGSMNNIDLNDVEQVSVLKDAASAAIYGVAAANGVILITTKRGKKNQKPKVSYSNSLMWSSPTYIPEYLGSADFAILYNEAYRNEKPGNEIIPFSEEDIQKFRDGSSPYTHPNTDWVNETLKKRAFEQHHHLGVTGGGENTSYSTAIGFLDQNGLLANMDYSRYNARMNVQSDINERLSVGINMSAYQSENNTGWNNFGGIYSWLTRIPPTVPVYNPDESYSYQGYQNALAHIGTDGFRETKQKELFTILNAQYQIIDGLDAKLVYSQRNTSEAKKGFKKHVTYQNANASMTYDSGQREMYEERKEWERKTGQFLINYNKTFGEHGLSALAGYEQHEYVYDFLKGDRKGFSSDYLHELNVGSANTQKNEGTGNDYSRQSYFGRIQYNYSGKYLLEGNLRYDGSSRFAKGERWGLFPAVSVGWRLSQESFLESATWLNDLKLRAGWGSTGNSETDYYESLPGYSYTTTGSGAVNADYIFGNNLTSGVFEKRYANEQLTWATVQSTEFAIEGRIFNGLFGWEFAAYKKKTTDMILKLPVPSILGIEGPNQNAGELENRGFDLSLTHKNYIGDDFSYDVSLNYGYVKNELTNLKGTEAIDEKYMMLEGHPWRSFYGYETEGLFQSQTDIDNHATQTGNIAPGDLKYKDQLTVDTDGDGVPDQGDGVINGDDRVVIGKNFPSHTFGFVGNVNYKNFEFSFFLQGVLDVDVYFENEAAFAFFNGGKVLERHLDRWHEGNPNASYPRLTLGEQHNFAISDYWLEDASYIRLKNISLAYNLPENWVSSIGISNLKVFFTGENLLTFSGLDNFDPEAPSVTRGWYYGNVKKLSVGVKVNF